ncbi:MAG: flagellar basal body rod protein FlgC [Eubacteriales bacterium]
MAFLSSFNIVSSGLTAQQLRMDVVSENVANMNTTRTEDGESYRRKMVVFEAQGGRDSFRLALSEAIGGTVSNQEYTATGGVMVTEIVEDPSDLKMVYDPSHEDADEFGYVHYPNVDLVVEMADAMAASQAYSANVTILNLMKSITAKGLEIGR